MTTAIEQLMNRYDNGAISRRGLIVALAALAVAPVADAAPAGATRQTAAPIPVTTMNHITLTVSDVRRSVDFYQRVLGLPLVTNQGNERDWNANAVPVLGVGNGPQFIAFSQGDRPHINHYCLGWPSSTPRTSCSALPPTASKRGSVCAPTPTRRPRN